MTIHEAKKRLALIVDSDYHVNSNWLEYKKAVADLIKAVAAKVKGKQ